MNKKIILLISALICANAIMFAAQMGLLQPPFETVVEQSRYQNLIDKFYGKALTAEDDTAANRVILGKRAVFLVQKLNAQLPDRVSAASSISYSMLPSLVVHSLMGDPKSSFLLYWFAGTIFLHGIRKVYSYSPSRAALENELKAINAIIHELENKSFWERERVRNIKFFKGEMNFGELS